MKFNRWALALAAAFAAGPSATAMERASEPVLIEEIELSAAAEAGGGGGGGLVITRGEGGSEDVVVERRKDPETGKEFEKKVIIKGIEPGQGLELLGNREATWLGLSTEEAPEILISQMGLPPGVGLVVNYVNPESPAAKAGLQKNDLLVEFEGQSLVLPGQLRKLVHSRKEGDKVRLEYYRAGKKQAANVTLARTKGPGGLFFGSRDWEGPVRELQLQLKDLPVGDYFREHMNGLKDSLGHLKLNQDRVKDEVRRSIEEAKRALERALRESRDEADVLGPAERAIREIERSHDRLGRDASVVVRSSGKNVRSVVRSDDDGTLVVVADPKPRLTAHDKGGKLLFDGPIDTPEDREKVPADLWKRVEPLLDKVTSKAEDEVKN